MLEYEKAYERAKNEENEFWRDVGERMIEWDKPFGTVHGGEFGADKWFEDGMLNACYNCIDRWVKKTPNKTALIFYNNENKRRNYTYSETLEKIMEISHWLQQEGKLEKGDVATLYLSTGPEAVFSMLACARLGITHNVVFGGFSSQALGLRIKDSKSKCVITQCHGPRGNKVIDFLETTVKALSSEDKDVKTLVFDNLFPCPYSSKGLCKCPEMLFNDFNSILDPHPISYFSKWSTFMPPKDFVPPVSVHSTHPLFFLYTSGSTGRPKGMIHSTGGYLVYAAYSFSVAFCPSTDDIFFCTADLGWITGHTYSLYAPLAFGSTSVIMEGLPTFPNHHRLFSIVEDASVTHLYTAPTVIRILKAYFSSEPLQPYNLSSIKLLGSVGEPINRDAYLFFSNCFSEAHVVDTYFQTETGGIIVASFPGPPKAPPECAAYPLPGVNVSLASNEGTGPSRILISASWPGIALGIVGDTLRFKKAYFGDYGCYFTGDEGTIDPEGRLWVRGRADDVINVAGHRLSTSEVESAALSDPSVAEAAVIAAYHPIKGQAMILFVALKEAMSDGFGIRIKKTVSEKIGRLAEPDAIMACSSIPKTSTGKLMRRVLRAVITGEDVGDLSTCVNREAVDELIDMYRHTVQNYTQHNITPG